MSGRHKEAPENGVGYGEAKKPRRTRAKTAGEARVVRGVTGRCTYVLRPRAIFQARVEVVAPALPALLVSAAREHGGDARPVLTAILLDELCQMLVLGGAPQARPAPGARRHGGVCGGHARTGTTGCRRFSVVGGRRWVCVVGAIISHLTFFIVCAHP